LEVQSAVETRLRMLIPVLPRWPQAMALSAAPNNAPKSLKLLLHLADDICHNVGKNELDVSVEIYHAYTQATSGTSLNDSVLTLLTLLY
jgi:ubiquinone biosynthesis protein COQ9